MHRLVIKLISSFTIEISIARRRKSNARYRAEFMFHTKLNEQHSSKERLTRHFQV